MPSNLTQSIHEDDSVLLGWHCESWKNRHKSKAWWLGAAVVLLLLITLMLIYENYMGAFLFALIGGAYYLFSHAEPEVFPFTISELGIYYGDRFWQYQQIKQFWIVLTDDVRTLHFEIQDSKGRTEEVMVQLEDVDARDVRELLAKNIPEGEGKEEDFFHKVGRLLKV